MARLPIDLPRLRRSSAAEIGDVAALPMPGGPPGVGLRRGEIRAGLQLPRLLAAVPRLRNAPRGDGRSVIDIPGWKAPEASLVPVRAYLRLLGWDARGWGLGTNRGDPEGDAERLAPTVVEAAEHGGRPVSLVGWSLGGVIAREVARELPGHVASVVTYGTPVEGGPTHTAAASLWGPVECERIARRGRELDAERPIEVPVTAIFSRRDGVVSWPACVDRSSPRVRHYEVGSTHLGLGIDPDVLEIVARSLAAARI
jgi:hypothetical protein